MFDINKQNIKLLLFVGTFINSKVLMAVVKLSVTNCDLW